MKMEKLMGNENLWNIHELIFGDFDHDTVVNTSYDLNAKDILRRTVLDVACQYGRTEIVMLLLKSSKVFSIFS